MIGLNDFCKEADNAAGNIKFPATLALAHGKLAKKIFINTPESIIVH